MVTFSDGDYVLLTVVNVLLPIWYGYVELRCRVDGGRFIAVSLSFWSEESRLRQACTTLPRLLLPKSAVQMKYTKPMGSQLRVCRPVTRFVLPLDFRNTIS